MPPLFPSPPPPLPDDIRAFQERSDIDKHTEILKASGISIGRHVKLRSVESTSPCVCIFSIHRKWIYRSTPTSLQNISALSCNLSPISRRCSARIPSLPPHVNHTPQLSDNRTLAPNDSFRPQTNPTGLKDGKCYHSAT